MVYCNLKWQRFLFVFYSSPSRSPRSLTDNCGISSGRLKILLNNMEGGFTCCSIKAIKLKHLYDYSIVIGCAQYEHWMRYLGLKLKR